MKQLLASSALTLVLLMSEGHAANISPIATYQQQPTYILAALVRPDVKREGYRQPKSGELTSTKLIGAHVYGANDEDVGKVNKLVLNADGSIKELVLDIGGFLGMGEHRIAVGLDQVNIMLNEKGNDVRVYVNSDKAALKALPTYNG